MSYKLNQKDPTRRAKLLARRNKDHISYQVNEQKKLPGYIRNTGLLKSSRRYAMIRFLLRTSKERLKEPKFVESIRMGIATRRYVYGFHPTKG